MLVLNEKQITELNNLLQELPMKYGVPIVNLIRSFVQENQDNTKTKASPGNLANNLKAVEVEAE